MWYWSSRSWPLAPPVPLHRPSNSAPATVLIKLNVLAAFLKVGAVKHKKSLKQTKNKIQRYKKKYTIKTFYKLFLRLTHFKVVMTFIKIVSPVQQFLLWNPVINFSVINLDKKINIFGANLQIEPNTQRNIFTYKLNLNLVFL